MLKISLKQYMNERHLTIQNVTEMTGVSRPTISQLASGKAKGIQFETLSKLANGLNADVSELFDNQFSFETIQYYVKPVTESLYTPDGSITTGINCSSTLIDEDEPTIEVGFYYDGNITDVGTVTEFKVPTRLILSNPINGSDTVYKIEWLYDDLGEALIENYNEQKLYDFLSSSPINSLEKILGGVSRGIIQLLETSLTSKYKTATYVSFNSDLPIHRLPNESLNFLWDKKTLLNKKLFDQLIDIKY
ncbi:helix-turn-helix domain-containing protein [Furfurilactobacillus cerevisiae]|uniref:helix-turn-helix domain-containing protein n=1 Tax=Furfurilactobacillus rossiae TaxID=231049 RepID=UPI003B987E5A